MTKEKSPQARAAAMIRQYCKEKGITARIKSESFAGGNSVWCKVEDQTAETVADLEKFVKQFQYGSFDGMTDCYNLDNRRDDLPQVKFAFVENRYSDAAMQRAWTFARGYYADCADLAEDLSACRDIVAGLDRYPDQIARRLLTEGKVK